MLASPGPLTEPVNALIAAPGAHLVQLHTHGIAAAAEGWVRIEVFAHGTVGWW